MATSPATDLDAAIRARLDGRQAADDGAPPGFSLSTETELSPENAARWKAAWEQVVGEALTAPLRIVHPARFYPGFEPMRAALLAVLDRHQPDPEWTGTPRCKTCLTDRIDWSEMWEPEAWPCGELRDIATALGVEVPDA